MATSPQWVVGILTYGCGVIGRTQIVALLQQFDHIGTVHVYDLNRAAAQALASDLTDPMGMAVEDIARAAEVYTRARRQRIGTWLDCTDREQQ